MILAAKSHSLRQFGKMVKLKEFLGDSSSAHDRDYCSMMITCRIFQQIRPKSFSKIIYLM